MDFCLSLYQPSRSCQDCGYQIEDDQVETCSICKGPIAIHYEWKEALATSLLVDQKHNRYTVFLSRAIFPTFPFDFDFPVRLLTLIPGGQVAHIAHIEETHILEEVPFWKKKSSLSQLEEAKGTLVKEMKWKPREPRPEEEKALLDESNSGTCVICGALYDFGYQSHLDDNSHMKEMSPGIFLGAQWNSVCLKELAHYKIQAVLNCASEIPGKNRQHFLGYKHLLWRDDDSQDIVNELPGILQWIQTQQESKRNLLVHCAEARSRSVTVLCAFLIKSQGKTLEEALHIIRKHKPLASPNNGFMKQLLSLQHVFASKISLNHH